MREPSLEDQSATTPVEIEARIVAWELKLESMIAQQQPLLRDIARTPDRDHRTKLKAQSADLSKAIGSARLVIDRLNVAKRQAIFNARLRELGGCENGSDLAGGIRSSRRTILMLVALLARRSACAPMTALAARKDLGHAGHQIFQQSNAPWFRVASPRRFRFPAACVWPSESRRECRGRFDLPGTKTTHWGEEWT